MQKTNSQTQNDAVPPVVMEDVTPPMLNDQPAPVVTTTQTTTTTVQDTPNTDSGSAAPSDDIVMPPIITSQKKKFAGGKVIATILGLFLLIGGLGAGILLVGQNQDVREQAYDCVQDCIDGGAGRLVCGCECGETNRRCPNGDGNTDPATNGTNDGGGGTDCDRQCGGNGAAFDFCMSASSTRTCNQEALERGYVVPVGGGGPGTGGWRCVVGQNGYSGGPCLEGNSVQNIGCSLPSCFCGTIQIDNGCSNPGTFQMECGCGGNEDTPPEGTPPAITAVCQNVKAYSPTWTLLTTTQLSTLDVGSQVNFCVTGSATGGSFDRARFTINNVLQAETTTVRPTSTDFCQLYTIPAATTTFNVTAQIHHVTLDWK